VSLRLWQKIQEVLWEGLRGFMDFGQNMGLDEGATICAYTHKHKNHHASYTAIHPIYTLEFGYF